MSQFSYYTPLSNAAENIAYNIQQTAVQVVEPLKRLFGDWDATSDAMKLYQRISNIVETTIGIPALQGINDSLNAFHEFTGAKGIFKRAYEVISGEGFWEKEQIGATTVFFNDSPLRMASKVSSIIGDSCSLIKWLVTCNILDKGITGLKAQITSLGKSIKVLQGLQDVSGICSGMFSAPVQLMSLVRSVQALGLTGLIRRSYLFNLAQDITKIASVILMNVPGISTVYATATMAVGNAIALSRFIKEQYFSDKTGLDSPDLDTTFRAMYPIAIELSPPSIPSSVISSAPDAPGPEGIPQSDG